MRRSHHGSWPLAAAVLVVAAILVAASARDGRSGGDRRSAEPPTTPVPGAVGRRGLTQALGATRAVETGRVEVTSALTDIGAPDSPPGGRRTVARYRVAFDRRVGRVEVEADMPGAAAATSTGEEARGTAASSTTRLVAADDAVYVRAGPLAVAVGRTPGDWVKAGRTAFAAGGVSSDAARLLLDPLGPFDVVGDAIVDARVVGHDVIRGSPTTHLATRADLGVGVAPIGVWVDADGVIRRLEIRLAAHAADGPGAVVTTVELYAIGGPVSIAVPAVAGGEP